jgi:hypothetical protein
MVMGRRGRASRRRAIIPSSTTATTGPRHFVEPFRAPLVDRLVLTVLDRGQFSDGDFEKGESGGMFLLPEASKRFLGEYERWMLHGHVSEMRDTSARSLTVCGK